MAFQKNIVKKIYFRDYKNFDREILEEEIANCLNKLL